MAHLRKQKIWLDVWDFLVKNRTSIIISLTSSSLASAIVSAIFSVGISRSEIRNTNTINACNYKRQIAFELLDDFAGVETNTLNKMCLGSGICFSDNYISSNKIAQSCKDTYLETAAKMRALMAKFAVFTDENGVKAYNGYELAWSNITSCPISGTRNYLILVAEFRKANCIMQNAITTIIKDCMEVRIPLDCTQLQCIVDNDLICPAGSQSSSVSSRASLP